MTALHIVSKRDLQNYIDQLHARVYATFMVLRIAIGLAIIRATIYIMPREIHFAIENVALGLKDTLENIYSKDLKHGMMIVPWQVPESDWDVGSMKFNGDHTPFNYIRRVTVAAGEQALKIANERCKPNPNPHGDAALMSFVWTPKSVKRTKDITTHMLSLGWYYSGDGVYHRENEEITHVVVCIKQDKKGNDTYQVITYECTPDRIGNPILLFRTISSRCEM